MMEQKDLKTQVVKACVTAAQKKRYAELAAALGIGEADLVRRALSSYCQAENEIGKSVHIDKTKLHYGAKG